MTAQIALLVHLPKVMVSRQKSGVSEELEALAKGVKQTAIDK